ncbi:aromatic amino acid lyase [Microbacterium dauci]|uniref:Aromatic amino acid lyase n=1 Tax=Microbacterium dauci TaxID=3048008 RepID=A0ABT6ZBR8_9MICO|nr:aromatic amino acid lyase [Microbacterium sp. LX3-4]MDJ1113605.1 aromatic amino acid lyase [Microbacterium sp. LX3-4]
MSALDDVLLASIHGEEPQTWRDAEERISGDRDAVLRLVEHGATVYGFTTRVGPFDAVHGRSLDDHLLKDHLVGAKISVPRSFFRLLSATKAAQLSVGGSGISLETYRRIIHSSITEREGDVSGAWLASYGAADVVPGSWWLRELLLSERHSMSSGDFICSVSGSFVSTSIGIVALLKAHRLLARFLVLVPTIDRQVPLRSSHAGEARVRELLDTESTATRVQAAISMRDVSPVVSLGVQTIGELEQALESRLSHQSANPLIVAEPEARAVSQNSYLDFQLTHRLSATLSMLHLIGHHVQRLLDHDLGLHPQPELVQGPKVAQSILERSRALLSAPSFVSPQSGGVEDMYDMSLEIGVRVLLMCAQVEQCIELYEPRSQTHRSMDAMQSALGGVAARVDDVMDFASQWSAALRAGWGAV